MQRHDDDGRLGLRNDPVERVDAVLLVVLHADDGFIHAEHLDEIARAADDLLGALEHRAMVAGDVGLALRAVDDHGRDLTDAAGDLDVGRERRAAHTDDTGVLDDLDHLLRGQSVRVGRSLDLFADGVLIIVLDHDGGHVAAHGIRARLDRDHLAGNAGMDGSAETLELADLLTDLHIVTDRHDGGTRCTEVHRHGNDHLSGRGRELLDGLLIRCGLHVVGMNAAKESLCHCLHLIFYCLEQCAHYSIIVEIIHQLQSVVQS